MNKHDAASLAQLLEAEWAGTDYSRSAAALAEQDQAPAVGPYWPVGAPAPTHAHPLERGGITFVAAKSLGTALVFCFTVRDEPRHYLLCFELSEWPADDPVLAASSVYETVIRLVGAPGWQEKRTHSIVEGDNLTLIIG